MPFHETRSGDTGPEERAYLVGVKLPGSTFEEEEENLEELALLSRTAGAEVRGSTIQQRTRIDGSTYIGSGKLEQLEKVVEEDGVNLVVFDDDLSPAQARNIEKHLQVNVIDRTELILDIFSRRARTRQARIQVEIAQLEYALPRLRRLWDHLSRQAGGIGTRGPGETQLEVDRRKVRERIASLRRELRRIDGRARERRKSRGEMFNVTVVGYTNAGKSTLLNRMAGAEVLESGMLFSTLDSTTRRVEFPGGGEFLLTDTIGFIRKLPPHLVASFHATLLDVEEADLLLHLVDASAPRAAERIRVVDDVLRKVLGDPHPGEEGELAGTILVLNKTDLLDEEARRGLAARYPGASMVSAATGEGTGSLLGRIEEISESGSVTAEIVVPASDGRAISEVEGSARVIERRVEGEEMVFRVRMKRKDIARIERSASLRIITSG